ncbi:MFS transporter [Leucobacter weissii]|uniref:MFS transporter n=1 Tax=Leucobacter weissii TaxID=1983706 RepID=A0A939ML41_9MICO|nr:MFS transporter [Leucobacter weissii]MBO1901920.1 MFS transporter [Leucobacter weissii]
MSRTQAETAPPIAARDSAVSAALTLAVFGYALAQTLVFPALSTIQTDLGATPAVGAWIVSGFLLSGTILSPVLGALGDTHGPRRGLLAALLLAALGGIAAMIAPSTIVLIAARIVQGVSLGILPLSFAIVRRSISPHRQQSVSGLLIGAISFPFYLLLPLWAQAPTVQTDAGSVGFGGTITLAGLILLATLALTLWHAQIWQHVVCYALVGLGTGFVFGSQPRLIATHVPVTRTGAANGFNSIARSIGGILATQIIAAIVAAAAHDAPITDQTLTTGLLLTAALALAGILLTPLTATGAHA